MVAARNEWILSDNRALYRLAPVTLELRGTLKLPYAGAGFHLTDDGHSVWVVTNVREARRYALDTGDLELTVNSAHNVAASTGILIPLPGRPGTVVVAGLDDSGRMALIAYDQGVALPVEYTDDLQWMARSLQGVAAPDGLVYFSNGGQLRELELRADGLYLRRNLDAFNRSIDYRMAVADGLLIQGYEEVLDLESLKLLPLGTFARPGPGGFGYQTIFKSPNEYALRVFDLPSRQLRWQTTLANFNGLLGAGGRAGALLLGINGGWLPTPPNPGVDLQASATLKNSPLGVGQEFTVDLQLRQYGVWQAQGAKPGSVEILPTAGQLMSGFV